MVATCTEGSGGGVSVYPSSRVVGEGCIVGIWSVFAVGFGVGVFGVGGDGVSVGWTTMAGTVTVGSGSNTVSTGASSPPLPPTDTPIITATMAVRYPRDNHRLPRLSGTGGGVQNLTMANYAFFGDEKLLLPRLTR